MMVLSMIAFVFPAANNCIFFISFHDFLSLPLMLSKLSMCIKRLLNTICHMVKRFREPAMQLFYFFPFSFFLESSVPVQPGSCALCLLLSCCPVTSFILDLHMFGVFPFRAFLPCFGSVHLLPSGVHKPLLIQRFSSIVCDKKKTH